MEAAATRLFVYDSLDLGRRRESISRFVIALIVTGHFAFPLELLIAIV